MDVNELEIGFSAHYFGRLDHELVWSYLVEFADTCDWVVFLEPGLLNTAQILKYSSGIFTKFDKDFFLKYCIALFMLRILLAGLT